MCLKNTQTLGRGSGTVPSQSSRCSAFKSSCWPLNHYFINCLTVFKSLEKEAGNYPYLVQSGFLPFIYFTNLLRSKAQILERHNKGSMVLLQQLGLEVWPSSPGRHLILSILHRPLLPICQPLPSSTPRHSPLEGHVQAEGEGQGEDREQASLL